MEGRETNPVQRTPSTRNELLDRGNPGRQLGRGTDLEPRGMTSAENQHPHPTAALGRLLPRAVEAAPGDRRRVAEARVTRPEVDACGGFLRRILRHPGEPRPAPRPDRVEPELARDLTRGQSLPFDDAEPARRAQAAAPV